MEQNKDLKIQVEQNKKDIEKDRADIKRNEKNINITNDNLHNFKTDVYKRFDNVESNVNTLDKSLSEKMARLEVTYELTAKSMNEKIENSSKSTNGKIDEVNKKLDGFLEKKDTRNYDWLKIIGTVVLTIVIAYAFKKAGIY